MAHLHEKSIDNDFVVIKDEQEEYNTLKNKIKELELNNSLLFIRNMKLTEENKELKSNVYKKKNINLNEDILIKQFNEKYTTDFINNGCNGKLKRINIK